MDLNHLRIGTGPQLLLIHGLGGSIAVWRPVLDLLAAEREVIAVDMPGFGGSGVPANGFVPSAANMAAEIASFCDVHDFAHPHVAGNSLGGWVALEMAKQGAAESVCAISPAGLWRQPLEPRADSRQAVGRRLRPLIGPLMAIGPARRAVLDRQMVHPERVSRADATDLALGYVSAERYGEADREMRAGVFEHEDKVAVPVTLAWGVEDRVVGRPSRTRRPPGARYVEMPGWGHAPTWDDPEGVAKLILDASSGPETIPAGG